MAHIGVLYVCIYKYMYMYGLYMYIWLFLYEKGSFVGCLCNKNPTIWGLDQAPPISGNCSIRI